MSPSEIEDYVTKITWGGEYIIVNKYSLDVLLILRSLNLQDKNFIKFIYSRSLTEARDMGIMTRMELGNRLKHNNIWTDVEDNYIDKITKQIDDLKQTLNNIKKNSRSFKRSATMLLSYNATLNRQLDKKRKLFNNTAEDYAENMQMYAIVYCSTHNEFNNRYWKSWNDFNNEVDSFFIDEIISYINKIEYFDTTKIRLIARSSQWRFRWNAAKNIDSLFGKSILDLDSNQQNLIYWSQVYDSVYESYERPSDEIIEDDEALDNWFEDQDKKEKNERVSSGKDAVGSTKLSGNINQHGEIFIVTNPAMNTDSKYRQVAPKIPTNVQVENLNDDITKKFKVAEVQKIKKKGIISEKDLRNRGNYIARQIIGSNDRVLSKGNIAGHKKSGKGTNYPGGTI